MMRILWLKYPIINAISRNVYRIPFGTDSFVDFTLSIFQYFCKYISHNIFYGYISLSGDGIQRFHREV